MTNYEYYKDAIDLQGAFGIIEDTKEIADCDCINCDACIFGTSDKDCALLIQDWLQQEYKEPVTALDEVLEAAKKIKEYCDCQTKCEGCLLDKVLCRSCCTNWNIKLLADLMRWWKND